MKITKLLPQKRRRNRFSLYLDGSYALGVSAETVAKLKLFEGKEIDSACLATTIFQEECHKAMNYALRLLSYRMRSEKEIFKRLKNQGYSESVINAIIPALKNIGLIDNGKFAHLFVQDRLNLAKKGKRAIYAELLRKGVARTIIQEALAKVSADEAAVAKNLIEKYEKRYHHLSPEERKRRLQGLLLRRGFSDKTIESALGG